MRVYLLMCRVETVNSFCSHHFNGVICYVPLNGDGDDKSNRNDYSY
jgi:hypothetical protein